MFQVMKRPAVRDQAPAPKLIDDDPPEVAAATARGLADMAAGRVVPHVQVREWLMKLARGEKAERPQPWKTVD